MTKTSKSVHKTNKDFSPLKTQQKEMTFDTNAIEVSKKSIIEEMKKTEENRDVVGFDSLKKNENVDTINVFVTDVMTQTGFNGLPYILVKLKDVNSAQGVAFLSPENELVTSFKALNEKVAELKNVKITESNKGIKIQLTSSSEVKKAQESVNQKFASVTKSLYQFDVTSHGRY